MNVVSGYFDEPEKHHEGWFRVFRFSNATEIWLGHKYWLISW